MRYWILISFFVACGSTSLAPIDALAMDGAQEDAQGPSGRPIVWERNGGLSISGSPITDQDRITITVDEIRLWRSSCPACPGIVLITPSPALDPWQGAGPVRFVINDSKLLIEWDEYPGPSGTKIWIGIMIQ